MKADKAIATYRRMRAQPLWRLLASITGPTVIGLLQSHLYESERSLPASIFHERISRDLEELRAQGFVRARVNGKLYELDELPKLDKQKKHSIDVVVDRFKVRADLQQRLAESFETALNLADGRPTVHSERMLDYLETRLRSGVSVSRDLAGKKDQVGENRRAGQAVVGLNTLHGHGKLLLL